MVPYRIYLPRRFYRNFAFLASIKPRDDRGGYLFAVVNAFDTIVELGVKLEPAGNFLNFNSKTTAIGLFSRLANEYFIGLHGLRNRI